MPLIYAHRPFKARLTRPLQRVGSMVPAVRQAMLVGAAALALLGTAACSDSVEYHRHSTYLGGEGDAGPDAQSWRSALPPPPPPDGAPPPLSPALAPPDAGSCDGAPSAVNPFTGAN